MENICIGCLITGYLLGVTTMIAIVSVISRKKKMNEGDSETFSEHYGCIPPTDEELFAEPTQIINSRNTKLMKKGPKYRIMLRDYTKYIIADNWTDEYLWPEIGDIIKYFSIEYHGDIYARIYDIKDFTLYVDFLKICKK